MGPHKEKKNSSPRRGPSEASYYGIVSALTGVRRDGAGRRPGDDKEERHLVMPSDRRRAYQQITDSPIHVESGQVPHRTPYWKAALSARRVAKSKPESVFWVARLMLSREKQA